MRIGISGIAGRMGREVASLAVERNVEISLGVESEKLRGLNPKDIIPNLTYSFPIIHSPDEMLSRAKENIPDVIIDFSVRGAVIPYIEYVCKNNLRVGFVIGTTGFSEDELNRIKEVAQSTPILLSYNMSRGVNLLLKVLPEIKKNLSDFDIEIVEIHHRMKKDSPSGTALKIAEVLSETDTQRVTGREGMCGPRRKNELGIFAVRGGDVIGEHIVLFLGDGERLEFKHTVTSRRVFASGAIYSAYFIYEKLKQGQNGFFSSMF